MLTRQMKRDLVVENGANSNLKCRVDNCTFYGTAEHNFLCSAHIGATTIDMPVNVRRELRRGIYFRAGGGMKCASDALTTELVHAAALPMVPPSFHHTMIRVMNVWADHTGDAGAPRLFSIEQAHRILQSAFNSQHGATDYEFAMHVCLMLCYEPWKAFGNTPWAPLFNLHDVNGRLRCAMVPCIELPTVKSGKK